MPLSRTQQAPSRTRWKVALSLPAGQNHLFPEKGSPVLILAPSIKSTLSKSHKKKSLNGN